MSETQQEQATEGGEVEEQSIVSKLDDDGSNPFWPKGAGGPGQPDNPNAIDFVSIVFGADPADVTFTIKTTPVDQAWTFHAGDGTADQPIAAATNTVTHHYADKSSGKVYEAKVTSGADTDTRNVQY